MSERRLAHQHHVVRLVAEAHLPPLELDSDFDLVALHVALGLADSDDAGAVSGGRGLIHPSRARRWLYCSRSEPLYIRVCIEIPRPALLWAAECHARQLG